MKKPNLYQLFGQQIQVARKAKKITQTQLAEMLCERGYNFKKTPKQRISNIENGKDNFSIELLESIADCLGFEVQTELKPIERMLFL
jgi:transcriptional regulator with XRE-family HTH domain